MKRACRELRGSAWRRRQQASAMLYHARIVTDPIRLHQLYAEAAKRKRYLEIERRVGKRDDTVL